MANRGYDVVVDVDEGVRQYLICYIEEQVLTLLQGDLGHTDLQEDLEFHSSSRFITLSPSSPLTNNYRLQ